jgi:hypothetical protein
MPSHHQEFRAWLIEEKMVNRETLSKDQEKKLFSQFAEDYNTGEHQHFCGATSQQHIISELHRTPSNPPPPEILCECRLSDWVQSSQPQVCQLVEHGKV